MQTGHRSQWARNLGGGAKPKPSDIHPRGDRSALFFYRGGGAAKPPSRGVPAGRVACSLSGWVGRTGTLFLHVSGSSLSAGKACRYFHKRGRYPIDDAEILEFLQLWTIWNDVE